MNHIDLPEEVRNLIECAIPSTDALELLVFLAQVPQRHLSLKEIVHTIRPKIIAESVIGDCLSLFQLQGLVVQTDAGFAYQPSNPELNGAINALIKAYNERPVTLVRGIYEVAEKRRIKSFSDAFKFKKDSR